MPRNETPSPQALCDKQKKTAVYLYAEKILAAKVPAEVYNAEWATLREHFMTGLLDEELLQVLQDEREDWALEGLSSFRNVLQRQESRGAWEARRLQGERAAKAAAANMEMLRADLEEDLQDLARYKKAVEDKKKELDRSVCKYRRERYQNGIFNAKQFMKLRLSFVDIPAPVHIARELGEQRRLLEQQVRPAGEGSALVMIYLDLNIDHGPTTLVLLVEALKLLHLSANMCVCLRWMVRHANTTMDCVTKLNRKVEDLCIKGDICLSDTPATLLFDKDLHTNDKRPLSVRFSIGVSTQFGLHCAWMQTPAARGHLGMCSLVRIASMKQPANKDRGGIGEVKLTPKDRATQLGNLAYKALLDSLLVAALNEPADPGCGGGAPGHARKALIVQLHPGEFGELGHAVLDKILEAEAQPRPESPVLAYKGVFLSHANNLEDDSPARGTYPVDGGDVTMNLPLSRVFQGRLLNEWWESHPSASPAERVVTDEGHAIPKPTLRVCVWNGDVPEVMPEAAMKFSVGSDAAEEWKQHVAMFIATHGHATTNPIAESSGPDFSSEGLTRPLDAMALVDMPPRPDSEPELVPMARMVCRHAPLEITLEKDTGLLFLSASPDAGDQQEFEVGPCELFGFGLGSFVAKPQADACLEPLACLLADDCSMVVRLPEEGGSKCAMPLATVLFACERHDGAPDVQVQGHTLTPNGTHFHRYGVQPEDELFCMQPKEVVVPNVNADGALPLVRAGEFGAVLLANNFPLPTAAAGLVWEMALDRVPPPTLTFSKPKVWLLQRMKITKGKHYKLARAA